MEGNTSFGGWLRRRRKALALSQQELAQRAGCSPTLIRMVEADAGRPSRLVAERLADLLELAPTERAAFVQAAHLELNANYHAPPPQHAAPRVVPPARALPEGTVTFLFTDIEGSTRLWEQHPAAMQTALARHDTIVRTAIETHAGVVVKYTGDGFHAAFARPADGLIAALSAQRALQVEVWPTPDPLRVRMGLHTGVAEMRARDYFGPPLNRAARLMAAGHGGQILVTRTTQELVQDSLPPGVVLRDLGEHQLKDLARPEHVFQLVAPDLPANFPPLKTSDAPPMPLPPAQAATTTARESPAPKSLLGSTAIARQAAASADHNRHRLLAKVATFWITGVLEQSLHGAALLALGLEQRPDAVTRPWDLLIQPIDQSPRSLPSGMRIIQVFDALDGELLILGAPGAGKTTTLLELARELLARAERDQTLPMPVVFNLSAWATKHPPLTEWLADELTTRYDVPHTVATEWVATDQVLPLLDGLDEVQAEYRMACVEAINTFRNEHGLVNLAVCSRIADYEELTAQLRLQGAVVVQPLTNEQIDAYLSSAGEHLVGLRAALVEDAELRELATSPLMLSVMTLAYQDQATATIRTTGTIAQQRDHLFTAYVAAMFHRRGRDRRYPQERAIGWLTWLATQMQQHSQTVFFIEQLPPSWLATRRKRRLYWLSDRLLGIAVCVLNCLLVYGLIYGLGGRLAVDLGNWLLLGLVNGLLGGLVLSCFGGHEKISQGEEGHQLRATIAGALVGGLVFGLVYGLIAGPSGVAYGVIGALFGALLGTLVGPPRLALRGIVVVETLRWSWAQALRRTRSILLLGGLLFGLLSVLIAASANPLRFDLRRIVGGVISGLVFALVYGLLFGLGGGLVGGELEMKAYPNQGIRRSVRSALLIGLCGSLIGGLGFGLLGGLRGRLDDGLSFGLLDGPVLGFACGGYACLSHLALRLVLWRSSKMPWNYARFLDYCVERIFLRKVGGGYIFVHRLLLEHFASLGNEGREMLDT